MVLRPEFKRHAASPGRRRLLSPCGRVAVTSAITSSPNASRNEITLTNLNVRLSLSHRTQNMVQGSLRIQEQSVRGPRERISGSHVVECEDDCFVLCCAL
jgi:hypothetical protein